MDSAPPPAAGRSDIAPAILTQPPRPPEIVLRPGRPAAEQTAPITAARVSQLISVNGARKFEGAQLPFFFESEIGNAYLRAGPARAIAIGEPRAECPAFGAALGGASLTAAANDALDQCLGAIAQADETRCGCRLVAAGGALLAGAESFSYARAIHAKLYGGGGAPVSLIVEERDQGAPSGAAPSAERLADLARGVRQLTLFGPSGAIGALTLTGDGGAQLDLTREGDARTPAWRGRWSAEGFRRGRLAKTIALTSASGAEVTLLIGYEPDELAAREPALLAAAERLFAPKTALKTED